MGILVTIIAAVVLVGGIFFNQQNRINSEQNTPTSEVLSESEEQEEEQAKTSPPADVEEDKTPVATATAKTPTPTSVHDKLSDYKYPNSQIVNSSSDSLLLNSNDNSDTITNWYKDKIESAGMNVKSFVETRANDNVSNQLVGADGQKEIRIEIKKDSGASIVEISVSLTI